MSTITFDKMAYVDTLKASGVDEKQAKVQANALDVALRDTVATSYDLQETRGALSQDIVGVKHEIEMVRKDMQAMEQRLTIRLGAMLALAVGVLAVLMKIL